MNIRKKFLSMLTAATMLAGVFCNAACAGAEGGGLEKEANNLDNGMDVTIASESFPLKIMGKQVTSENMDNITGDGSKSYSFDGDHTLTISTYPGSGLTETYYGGEAPIIYSELDGLVIKTVNSPIIVSTNNAIVLKANTTMTGCSLTISAAETAISVENGKKLTITNDSEINVSRSKFGITGLLCGESLEIARSDVNVTSTDKAIGYFDGGITIDDSCEITKPADGYIGNSSIASAGGTNVTEVTITRKLVNNNYGFEVCDEPVTVENKDDIFGDGRFSFDGDHTLTVKGIARNSDSVIFNRSMDGLIINIVGDCVFEADDRAAIYAQADTVITGSGTLWLKCPGGDAIDIYEADLEIHNVSIYNTSSGGIVGNYSDDEDQPRLTIDGAAIGIDVDVEQSAITGFDGGIALNNCAIVTPQSGKVTDGSITASDGSIASSVAIVPTHGELASSDGKRSLSWAFIPATGEVVVTEGDVSEDTPLLVASYDENGVCIGVTMMTRESYSTIAVKDGASRIKLIWWDMPGNQKPISAAAGFKLFN